jgi:flagellar secretion chaperone FliS
MAPLSELPRPRLLHRAVAILDELRASLDFENGGQIAANLADIYDYASRQLMRANLECKVEPLNEVSHLLREIRGAWMLIPATT